jgi:hypothetical protein
MNAEPGWWRRLALLLAQHAVNAMPGARAPWARAMRCELDHIADDAAAFRWALGCVLATYQARLPRPRSVGARAVWHVAASSAAMLVIGVALHDNAGGQTRPPLPASDKTGCDRPRDAEAVSPSQDRSPLRRPIDVAANNTACRADCADPPHLDSAKACETPDSVRGP